MSYFRIILVSGLWLAFVIPVFAADDLKKSQAKAHICASCHGADGFSPIPNYPNLAGQNAAYISYALKLYRTKTRQGDQAAIMYAQAAKLSDQDIADLAAYFSSLTPFK